MRTPALIFGLMLSVMASGPAFAQGDGDLAAQKEGTRQINRQVLREAACPGYARGERFHRDERGADFDRRFRRGDCLPLEYRSHSYVVDDWRGHRLAPPPAGYHWVQIGGDYVLVAKNSGRIRQLRRD